MDNKLDTLREIRLEVTRHCNCKCYFCHNQNTFAKEGRLTKKDLSTEQIKYIIDQVSLTKVSKLRFTGGEPLVKPDILELIKYAKSKGLQVRLNTNGTLIDKKTAEVLKKYVDTVLISVLSVEKEENDSIVALKGGFEKKLEAIKSLRGAKPDLLWGCTVITKKNIDELEKIADFVYSMGFDYWFCLRQVPSLQDKNSYSYKDCKNLVEKLLLIKEKYVEKYRDGEVLNNAFPFCAYNKDIVNTIASGAIYGEGHSSLVIDPEGNVLVDYAYDEKMGNIFENSLEEIWNSKKVKNFRELKFTPRECHSCKYFEKCKGGSRIASLISNNKIDGRDPLMRK